VRYLFDTHLLLWAASEPERLPEAARTVLVDEHSSMMFSAVSMWEVAIKASLGRPDFAVDAHLLYRGLLEAGYGEVAVTGRHAVAVVDLPPLHEDPFDRILVCQARAEGLTLVTSDENVARYSKDIHLV
jgi:PIN domain nuclease of toxin-antitoxin system